MLEWKDEYAIGVSLIDSQHKHLFEIGNNAYALLTDDFDIDKYHKVIEILEDLRQYAKFHFKSEEEYMLKINYNNLFSQKVAHADFIEKIDDISFELSVGEDPKQYLEELLTFVFDWILDHIIQKDKLIHS